MAETTRENIEFKAEVSEILNLVINSLYSHKEVFLRELVSNASDAIDKHRHLTLVDTAYRKPDEPYAVRIAADKEKKTLTISDNGIGMSREELIENIGTIASSGTKAFLEKIKQSKNESLQLIGQFGVGFYSTFMVASKVRIETRRAGTDGAALAWESEGRGSYSIEEGTRPSHGSDIILYLKDEELEYLDEYRIREIVKKYSDYVSYPIILKKEKGEEETINKVQAIWRRPKNEVKQEEYYEFYKYISHDIDDPLLYSHHSMEGTLEYKALVFIPKKAPINFYREDMHGLRLHVKRMFVTDQCRDLLPPYLRFVRGVVDSEDLPLNVSRETLQQNPVIMKMRKQLTKTIFDMLEDLAKNDAGKYNEFILELGIALKEGITMDFENRDRLLELVRYQTSIGASEKDLVSLADYVNRMKPDQKYIYYLSGANREACLKSPHLETFRSRGIEVLFMVDMIDEWSTPAIVSYKDKELKSITRGDLDASELGEEAKKEQEEKAGQYRDLVDAVRSALQEEVKEVRITKRLNESPSCLVTDEGDMDVKMQQIMKAMGKDFKPAKRILELNPDHPLLRSLRSAVEKDAKHPKLRDWAWVLYEEALLAEGTALKDPAGFVKRINELLAEAAGKEGGR